MRLLRKHSPLVRTTVRCLSDGLFGMGVVLLGFSVFGLLHTNTSGVPALVSKGGVPPTTSSATLTEGDLLEYVARVRQDQDSFHPWEATRWVYEGTRHSDSRRIHPAENWMQWTLSLFYSPLARSQDSRRLVAGGAANCSERSQILKTIAEAAGCECRFVGLRGHVVLEIRYQNRWHVADPDYGVVFPHGIRQVEQEAYQPQVRDQLAAVGHSRLAIDNYLALLGSRADNAVLPTGSPLSPRLYAIEQLCRRLTWVLPLTCLGCGWLLANWVQPESSRHSDPNPGDDVRPFIPSCRHHLRLWVGYRSDCDFPLPP